MYDQKTVDRVAAYYDSRGPWRLTYFDQLVKTPDAELPSILRYEKEYIVAEQSVLDTLVPQADRILEVGCAEGRSILGPAAAHPEKIFVGVDVAVGQLTVLQHELQRRRITNIIPLRVSASSIPLLDRSIDLVAILNQTIGNFLGDDRRRSFEEVVRLMRDDGTLLIGGYSNVALAAEGYKAWDIKIRSIDMDTGFIRLEPYNSLWQKSDKLTAELEDVGLQLVDSVEVTLGYVNTYKKVGTRSSS